MDFHSSDRSIKRYGQEQPYRFVEKNQSESTMKGNGSAEGQLEVTGQFRNYIRVK